MNDCIENFLDCTFFLVKYYRLLPLNTSQVFVLQF